MEMKYLVFTLIIIISTVFQQVDAYAKRRRKQAPCKHRGYPHKTDRIAIIGAGPAGVHMAYKLQRLGYADITIFEKTERIGGKCLTVNHKGTRQEMGAGYTTVDYDEVFKLVDEFNMGRVIPIGKITRWTSEKTYFEDVDYPLYVIAKEYGITDTANATAFLLGALQRYVQLHKSLFSDYEGELFPRPNATVLQLTRGSFLQFLKRNNMEVLKTIFISTQTIPGYGQLDEISALYGLLWNTPRFISARVSGLAQALGTLEKGYQKLFEKIVLDEKIKIIFNADIRCITRFRDIKIRYYHNDKNKKCKYMKTSQFDFLILASNIKDLLYNPLKHPSREERRIFNRLHNVFVTSVLVDTAYGRRGKNPSDYYLYKLPRGVEQDVWVRIDFYGALNELSGDKYKNGVYPGNPQGEFRRCARCWCQNKKFRY